MAGKRPMRQRIRNLAEKIGAIVFYEPADIVLPARPAYQPPPWMDVTTMNGNELNAAIQLGYVSEKNLTSEQHEKYTQARAATAHLIAPDA